jgi:cysteinyl-tRNA synthetase
MCRYWMHNGLMQASSEVGKLGGRKTESADGRRQAAANQTDGTLPDLASQEAGKISKSKGSNAFSDMLKQVEPETIRFFLLSTHDRRPIDFSMERIEEVGKGLETFYRFAKRYEKIAGKSFYDLDVPKARSEAESRKDSLPEVAELRSKFLEAMDDDFNTGGAIGILFDLLRVLNRFVDENKLESGGSRTEELTYGASVLRELGLTLGLFIKPPQEKESAGQSELVGKLVTLLIELRAAARKNKDFATADKIRKDLTDFGITLEDRHGGTEWSLS